MLKNLVILGLVFIFSLGTFSIFSQGQNQLVVNNYNLRDGLSQMKVSCIAEDHLGNIWIGTRNGLNRFNGATFQKFSIDQGLLSNRILSLMYYENLLYILCSTGLSIYDGKNFKNIKRKFERVEYKMNIDKKGNIYFWTRNELYRLDQDSIKQLVSVDANLSILKVKKDPGFILVSEQNCLDINRDIICSSSEFKIREFSIFDDNFSKSYLTDSQHFETYHYFDGLAIKPILHNKLGRFHYLQNQSDYLVFNDTLHRFNKRDLNGDKLGFSVVHCVFKDSNSNLWIGSDEGLSHIYSSSFDNIEALNQYQFTAICENKKGAYLLASYGDGLYSYQEGNKKPTKLNTGLTKLFNGAACANKNGECFFACEHGILKSHGDGFDILSGPTVFNTVIDSSRNQILGGTFEGLVIFNENNESSIVRNKDLIHANHYIQNISVDHLGDYWCGSYSGLTRYNPDKEASTQFTEEQNNLPLGRGVFCTFQDGENNLWIGGSNGLMHYNFSSKKILGVNSEILNQQIKSIIELPTGELLLGGKNDLFVFNKNEYLNKGTLNISFYNYSNGYEGIEPIYSGFFKDAKNRIWVISSTSVDLINEPKKIRKSAFPKSNIKAVNNQALEFDHLCDTIISKDEIIILEVESIGIERLSQVSYKYRLNDSEWSDWISESHITLNKLNHGISKFELVSGPSDDLDNAQIDSIFLFVDLPIYRRSYFLPILLLSIIGFMVFSFWKRREEKKRLTTLLEESKYLKSQLLLSELNPHFIFNVLAGIQNKILLGDKDSASNMLVQLSSLIRNFLNVSYHSNKPNNKLEFEISLTKEIELLESYLNFEVENNNGHFEYKISVEKVDQMSTILIPPMLIQPFVENAIKHGLLPQARGGILTIKFYLVSSTLFCEIQDSGVGIREKKPEYKFLNKKSLGSKIVEERVQLLNELGYNISIDTKSEIDKGTTVTIKFGE